MSASTTTTINGKHVTHGDTIISFRGEEFTFDHTEDDRIVTKERPTRFLHRVFVDVKEGASA
jgi:hypothetical protein